ncbi:MAG: hypothetical protein ABIW94_03560 [Gemmatimonadaceae bacterium]
MKKTAGDTAVVRGRSDSRSRVILCEQKLEDYVLPQTSDIVTAVRRLAAY